MRSIPLPVAVPHIPVDAAPVTDYRPLSRATWVLSGALALLCIPAARAQIVTSATGTTAASITSARDAFRTALGGGTVAGANGSFGGVRREINWDGVPAAFSAPNLLPPNFFNVNSPRGTVFSTPGTGFEVSGATTDAGAGQPAAANFGNINPNYTTSFAPFSPQRLFTALGSTITDVNFFAPGTTNPALVRAFGVVFSDVDLASSTSLQFFDINNSSLGTFFAPATPGIATFSFLGVDFSSPVVARVRITSGNAALSGNTNDQNGDQVDLVAMDDFIYSEPSSAPEPGSVALLLAGVVPLGVILRRRVTGG